MIDLSKPVQTRDGRKVRILCTDAKGSDSVVGLIQLSDGGEKAESWKSDGSYLHSGPYFLDLVNVPEPIVGYVYLNKKSKNWRYVSSLRTRPNETSFESIEFKITYDPTTKKADVEVIE